MRRPRNAMHSQQYWTRGRRRSRGGPNGWPRKLTQQKADTLRKLRKAGWKHREIAERYGISPCHSCNVNQGRYWNNG